MVITDNYIVTVFFTQRDVTDRTTRHFIFSFLNLNCCETQLRRRCQNHSSWEKIQRR